MSKWDPLLGSMDIATLRNLYRTRQVSPIEVIGGVYRRIAARGDDAVWIHVAPEAAVLERAKTLANNFAAQWLHLRNLDSIIPDLRLFTDFDDNLRKAFRRETELLFESVLREDRSALTCSGPTTRSSTGGSPGTTKSPTSTASASAASRSAPTGSGAACCARAAS